MPVVSNEVVFESEGNAQVVDITDRLREALTDSGLENGTLTAFVPGATGGLTTVEYEPGLVHDLGALWERIAPKGKIYQHDRAWGDGNGHSHVRASLLGPSLSVPFIDGAFTLGTWQQVIFVDFDVRPRQRRIVLQFIGK